MARLHILYCIVLYCNLLNVRLYRHHWKPRAAAAAAYSARLHIFVSVARWSSGAALNVSHQHHLSVPPTQRPCRTCRLTCISPATQTTHPIHSLTFRPVVGQLSEVAPFLLLEQRCGMVCEAMLRRPRRCRCSRTG